MVSDPLHRAIFPQFRLANDAASMRQFSTTQKGSYFAVGRGGALTGRGADLLLIDDPLKDLEEARSEVTRRALARLVLIGCLYPPAARGGYSFDLHSLA